MKKNTIKWRILKYNIALIILLIALTTIIFNVAVRIYIEKNIIGQLNKIALSTENTALEHGPDYFPPQGDKHPQEDNLPKDQQPDNKLFGYYLMLDHSLKEPLSVLNADFILLDRDKNRITPPPDNVSTPSTELFKSITAEINKSKNLDSEKHLNFNISGTEYIVIIKPVYDKNSFGLGWVIIYSSLQKINQLQVEINIILFIILIFSALVIVIFSSILSKKITEPFTTLNHYIKAISERNFGTKIDMPVYDELQEFVDNINIMSEKLETYDKAQKTFLQNVSHEFRTPLMSIQGYAEGIKYDVVESNTATDIIIDETKHMTHLVEDLLYLSRLDTIEENYHFSPLSFNKLITSCVERMNGIALRSNIKIITNNLSEEIHINADEEKLSRAITNVISNCLRYSKSTVIITSKVTYDSKIELTISDDGPGFENGELTNIFDRFYKGKKGNYGLGLSISKNVIEKLHGKITAENSTAGAVFIIQLPIDNNNSATGVV